MARHYLKIDEWEAWIPRQERGALAGEEPITMELRHLTKRQNDHYTRLVKRASSPQAVESDLRQLFAENVRNIAEYSTHDQETGQHIEIRTGIDLFEHGDEDIKISVTEALLSRKALDDGLVKKLRPSSGGEPRATLPSGDAPDAIQASSPGSQEISTPRIPSSPSTTPRNEPLETAMARGQTSITLQPSMGDARGQS